MDSSDWKRDLKADPFERVWNNKRFGFLDADLDQDLGSLPPNDPFYATNPQASKKIEAGVATMTAAQYVEKKRKQHKWQDPDTINPAVRLPGGAWKMAGERVPTADELKTLLANSRSHLNY